MTALLHDRDPAATHSRGSGSVQALPQPRRARLPCLRRPPLRRRPCTVDAALKAHDWDGACNHLAAMRRAGRQPKLGSIMRWVRDADATGSEAQAARVICAVLRAAEPPPVGAAAPAGDADAGTIAGAAASRAQPGSGNGSDKDGAAAANGAGAAAEKRGLGPASAQPPVRRLPAWVPPEPTPHSAEQELGATTAAAVDADGAAPNSGTEAAGAAGLGSSGGSAAAVAAAGGAAALGGGPAANRGSAAGHAAAVPGGAPTSGSAGSGGGLATRRPPAYEIQRAAGAGGQDSFITGQPVRIYAYPPGSAVAFEAGRPPPLRAEVPHVPGAFVVVGALSKRECRQILDAGHALGYRGDVDYSFSGPAAAAVGGGGAGKAAAANGGGGSGSGASKAANDDGGGASGVSASAARAVAAAAAGLGPAAGKPAEGCVWLVDGSVLGPLYERVKALLPQELCGCRLAGINPRWRLYRWGFEASGLSSRACPAAGGSC
jgi:hypothetical protein